MVSCKLIALKNREDVAVLCEKKEIPYKTLKIGEEEYQLKLYIEEVGENKHGKLVKGFADRLLVLYDRERGEFMVRVSEKLELQVYETEDPVLLGIFAKKDVSLRVATSLGHIVDVAYIYLDLTGNFDRIKNHAKFQDVRQLRLSDIRDMYLDKAILIGTKLHESPYARTVRVSLGASLNALAIVYRNTWVLVTRDARFYTPVPARILPGGREGFILDLYRELRDLDVARIQEAVV